jgi:serine protease Do
MLINRLIILLLATVFLSGCTGCSRSGREALKRGTDNGRPTRRVETKRPKVIEKKKSDVDEITQTTKPITEGSAEASLTELFNTCSKSVVIVFTEEAQGSGFIISNQGIGITNYHVLDDNTDAVVKTSTGDVYDIEKWLRYDKELDYVIFQLRGANNRVIPAKIASKQPQVGEEVFAIGNPKGLEQTLSSGIVSQIRDKYGLIQTTAEITNGSSGGALFNMQGEVIGITSSGVGEANLNFAIDIQKVSIP